ncbi:MAG TPA: hypothetical protein VGS79_01320 [Puia sp.]|nr:hypothetical protein [Puia sp.]
MKALSLLPFLLLCVHSRVPLNHVSNFINPTGTYILKGNVKKNNITGHYGELRVSLLDSQTVALCFYLSSGYPDYSAASMLDTLHYEDNCIHLQPGRDSTCTLVLTFSNRSVDLMKIYKDPATGCGFAPGVIVPATLNKISSEVPVIQDFSTRGRSGAGK